MGVLMEDLSEIFEIEDFERIEDRLTNDNPNNIPSIDEIIKKLEGLCEDGEDEESGDETPDERDEESDDETTDDDEKDEDEETDDDRTESDSDPDLPIVRPCGMRKSKKNPDAYSRQELEDELLDRGYSKKKLRSMKMDELCKLVKKGAKKGEKKDCSDETVASLREKAKKKNLRGYSKLKKAELCKMIFLRKIDKNHIPAKMTKISFDTLKSIAKKLKLVEDHWDLDNGLKGDLDEDGAQFYFGNKSVLVDDGFVGVAFIPRGEKVYISAEHSGSGPLVQVPANLKNLSKKEQQTLIAALNDEDLVDMEL